MIPRIDATIVFVQDLASCTTFYRDILGFQVQQSDEVSISFRVGDQYYLLLAFSEAASLLHIEIDTLMSERKPRGLLAAGVKNVDTTYQTLSDKGVPFLRPPTDQPWGLRTAHFEDPEGNIWEINHSIQHHQ